MTMRGISILKSVSLIGAEDTRKSAVLLSRYQITTPVVSYHKFNEKKRLDKFLKALQEGKDIAIITDAGTPGISDPAEIIIKAAVNNDIPVCTLPGASAFLPALVSSGLNCRNFVFLGFLPSQLSERDELLTRVSNYPETLILYETGKRLFRFLALLREYFGNRKTVIGREISKVYETYYRGYIDNILKNKESIILKGEFTVVCEGAAVRVVSDEMIAEQLQSIVASGSTISGAVSQTAKLLNVQKNRVYKIALAVGRKG